MDIMRTFFESPTDLQRILVESISSHLRQVAVSDSDIDRRCGFSTGTWRALEENPTELDGDRFLDICYALELEIEEAMPFRASPVQIQDVCEQMKRLGHGVVACGGRPPVSGNGQDSECASPSGISCEEQAELYIRLKALYELDEHLAARSPV